MNFSQQRLEALFDAALELKFPADRAAFLARECGDDTTLRERVERLLSAHERSEAFFDDCRPALSVTEAGGAVADTLDVERELGKTIGPYKLLQRIGEGGCGVVYMAEQDKPIRRRVALKVIKLGMDTKSVIARFEAERQALAMMDHPNIARVLDAGATETGRPYFVMELVHGVRITEYCDKNELETNSRLELFIQVCHAIQHAHQKGIIHRDIKPSNILITMHDGVPVPKVIDFGIAKAIEEKLTDKTLFTIYGNFIGTPAYMSPEQAEFSGLDIDTRSDIYSLGVLLYELLTGKTPFEQNELLASGIDSMRKTLREREPHRPSTRLDTMQTDELTMTAMRRHLEPPKLQLLLKGDLDWIVMKALEKDRRRRYETANGLALDVRRFLDNEPVMARSPSRWYRFQKQVRRNWVLFATGGAVAITLLVGLGAASWMFLKEREMRRRAVAAEQIAEEARANETALRQHAEMREKITQAAFLVSQGKPGEADQVVANINFLQPTLDGAAVLRALGEWHALHGRWSLAGNRFLQVLQVDQLDDTETVSRDFLSAGAVLAAAGEVVRLENLRRSLIARAADGKNAVLARAALRSCLLWPATTNVLEMLEPLSRAISPASTASIGNARHVANTNLPPKLELQNVGTEQPCSFENRDGRITMVGGGGNIYDVADQFAYAFTMIRGDFDYRMRVHSIAPMLDPFTRVGLMVREALASGSRHVMVAVNANNTFQVIVRSAESAQSESLPQNPLPATYGSNSWVRLQRVGVIFHAYTSSNGVDWTELYVTAGRERPFNDLVYFGIAACAHNTEAVATNVVSNFGPTPTVSAKVALTLALLDLRRDNFEAAEDWSRRLLAYPECNAVESATARLILAMACERTAQPAEAWRQLDVARQSVEKQFSGGLEAGDKAEGFWFDWVFARVLLNEAQALIR